MMDAHPMTLTEQVTQRLLGYLEEHNLQAGELLPTEVELAALLGVSRVALREALCYLKAVGLISSRRGSGLRVNRPDIVGVLERVLRHVTTPDASGNNRELLALRRTLELGSIADAVERADEAALQAIEDAYKHFERLVSCPPQEKSLLEEGTIPGLAEYHTAIDQAEIDFHTALMAPSGCRLLTIVLTATRTFFQQRRQHGSPCELYTPERLRQVCSEHGLIAGAFRARSPESAYFALRRHLSY